jgi:hypothetical protein
MNVHPLMQLMLINQRHRDLVDEAERDRLLASALEARKARKARNGGASRGQPTGTLTACDTSAAVPAR